MSSCKTTDLLAALSSSSSAAPAARSEAVVAKSAILEARSAAVSRIGEAGMTAVQKIRGLRSHLFLKYIRADFESSNRYDQRFRGAA